MILWEIKEAVLSILCSITGGILTFKEKFNDNERKGVSNFFNIGGLLLILFGASVSFVSAWHSNSQKKIDDKKIDSINNVLILKSNSLEQLQKEELDTSKYILRQAIKILQEQTRDSSEKSFAEQMSLYAMFDQIGDLTMEPLYDVYFKADSLKIREDIGKAVRAVHLQLKDKLANTYLLGHPSLKLKLIKSVDDFVMILNRVYTNPNARYYPILVIEKEYAEAVLDFRKIVKEETGQMLVIKNGQK